MLRERTLKLVKRPTKASGPLSSNVSAAHLKKRPSELASTMRKPIPASLPLLQIISSPQAKSKETLLRNSLKSPTATRISECAYKVPSVARIRQPNSNTQVRRLSYVNIINKAEDLPKWLTASSNIQANGQVSRKKYKPKAKLT